MLSLHVTGHIKTSIFFLHATWKWQHPFFVVLVNIYTFFPKHYQRMLFPDGNATICFTCDMRYWGCGPRKSESPLWKQSVIFNMKLHPLPGFVTSLLQCARIRPFSLQVGFYQICNHPSRRDDMKMHNSPTWHNNDFNAQSNLPSHPIFQIHVTVSSFSHIASCI